MFNDCENLKEIKGLNNLITNKVTNMTTMFQNCINLVSIDLSNFKTDNVTDMSYMFYGCGNLKEINLNNFKLNEKCEVDGLFDLNSLSYNPFSKKNCKVYAKDKNILNLF